MNEEIKIIENSGIEVFEAQERASIDSQVATAKRYPRDLMRCKNNSIAIACMDKETAECCRYAKPTGGKNVVGPSVHLARIIAQQYGNLKVLQRIKMIDAKSVVAEAIAFDMETNYAVSVEARRSIIQKNGQRYSDSVIETNAMAILAIAERNAILKVVPKAIIDVVYKEAFKFANGDLSDETKILKARKTALEYLQSNYGATEAEVLKLLGVRAVGQIDAEKIADLRAFTQSLKDGEITADELFGRKSDPSKNEIKPRETYETEQQIKEDQLKGAITKEQAEELLFNFTVSKENGK